MALRDILYSLKIDLSGAAGPLDTIKQKVLGLKADSQIGLKVDTQGAAAGLNQLGGQVQANVKSVKDWNDELKRLKTERDKAEDPAKITALNDKINDAAAEVKKLKDLTAKTPDPQFTEGFDKAADRIKSKFGGLKSFIGGALLSGALLGGAQEFVQVGSVYEAGIAELSAITGVAGASLDDLGNRARKTALEFGGSASGNITAFKTILSKLGPDIANTPAALDQMSRAVATLSAATGDTAEASVDALTTGLLQFQVPLDDASKAAEVMNEQMNILAAGAKFGAAEVPQVADAIRVAGVAASGAKVSFAETNAAIQALAAGGKVGAEAGTALRNVLGKLSEGRFLPKNTQAELKAAGVDINKLGDTTLSFTERMRELEKIQGDAALMTQLFGTENSAAAAILLRSVDAQDELRSKIEDTTTATDQAATRQQTFAAQMDKLKAVGADVGISIFQAVQPVLNFMVQGAVKLGSFIGAAVDLVGKNKVAMAALGVGITAVIGLLTVAAIKNFFGSFVTGTLQTALSIVQKLIPSLVTQTVTTTGAAGAQLALNTAMLAGPFAIVAGLAVVAAGAYLLFKSNTKDLGEATEDLTGAMDEYNKATDELVKVDQAAKNTRKLADEYDRLKNSGAEKDQKRLAEVTKELDVATGGAASTVDTYGNAIAISTDKVRGLTTENQKLAEQMRQAAWQNMLDQAGALGDAYSDAEDNLVKVRDQINSGNTNSLLTDVTAAFDSILGTDAAIKDIETDRKNARAEQAQEAEKRLTAQEKLVKSAILLEQARIAEGKAGATVSDIMTLLNVRNKQSAEEILRIARGQVEATEKQQKATEGTNTATKTAIANKESELAKIREKVDFEIQGIELAMKAEKGRELNNKEQLDVQRQRIKLLTDEITNRQAALAAAKETAKAQREALTQSTSEILLNAKVILDEQKNAEEIEKFKAAFLAKTEDLGKREIEIGIRPKEDSLSLMDRQIRQLSDELAAVNLKLEFDADGNLKGVQDKATREAAARAQDLKAQLLGITQSRVRVERDLDTELTAIKIGNITTVGERELAELKAKQARELQYINDRRASGVELTQRELDVEKELKIKHAREMADLGKKYHKEDLLSQRNLTQDFYNASLALLKKHTEAKKQITDAERDRKYLDFDKERTTLENQLQSGAIDQREYTVLLAEQAQKRAEFEKQTEGEKVDSLLTIGAHYLGEMGLKYADHFNSLLQQELLQVIFHTQAEQDKTQATIEGANARQAAQGPEVEGNLKSASSSILGAAASQVAKVVALIPFPFNIPAAIAASFAVTSLLGKLKGALGFETGGLAWVGEKGPEVIGPAKDFSAFATQLITSTVKATQQSLAGGSGGGQFGGGQDHRFSFEEVKVSGDSLSLAVKGAEVRGQSELMITE